MKVLVISPHTDDAEVAAGGTISRFLREGQEVFSLVLSSAFSEEAGRPALECKESLRALGITDSASEIHAFPVRHLPDHRQEILDLFIEAKKRIDPSLVLVPSINDIHQDHHVVTHEALRAFKDRSILGWEYPWNHLEFHTTAFFKLQQCDMDNKLRAIAKYESQKKPYLAPEVILAWAITRGVAVGTKYAESFEVVRWVA